MASERSNLLNGKRTGLSQGWSKYFMPKFSWISLSNFSKASLCFEKEDNATPGSTVLQERWMRCWSSLAMQQINLILLP